ncbi:TPA: Hsp20 family protein [Legionella pneumophila]|nr:Hsp20 family protein [Legionella pneumophila]HAT8182112.1 Hsp20 family protein [Legionella pneumophila]
MGSLRKHQPGRTTDLLMSPFLRLQQEVNHAMSDFYNLFDPQRSANLEQFEHISLTPSLDIVEDKDSFKIEAEMPGLGEEDIKVSFCENRLTIEGEKSTSKKDENKNYISREISYGRYERTISLPLSADVDKATASFKKGMLWITIPKKTKTKEDVKTIKIEKAK